MEPRTLLGRQAQYDLKARGHQLIETLVDMGVKQHEIYERMAKRLGVSILHAHFSMVSSTPQLERMLEVLETMRKEEKLRKQKDAEKMRYAQICDNRELLREVGRRNSIRCVPRWKRILYELGVLTI